MKTAKKKKRTSAKPQPITHQVLRKEISRLDVKVDTKVDSADVSTKDHTDSKFDQLDRKVDGLRTEMREGFALLGNKLDQFVKTIADIYERYDAQIIAIGKRGGNREKGITVLEKITG